MYLSNEHNYYTKSVAEIQVNYVKKNEFFSVKINESKSAADFLRSVFPVQIGYREAFIALYLNRQNQTVRYSVISIGGISGTVADQKVIFQHGLMASCSSIILCHNHPSSALKPSQADLNMTKKAKSIGELMDMPVLDHIILTEDHYFSFADEGLI